MTDVGVNLRELTDSNRGEVLALRRAPGQEHFVSSVAGSLGEAQAYPRATRGIAPSTPAPSRSGSSC